MDFIDTFIGILADLPFLIPIFLMCLIGIIGTIVVAVMSPHKTMDFILNFIFILLCFLVVGGLFLYALGRGSVDLGAALLLIFLYGVMPFALIGFIVIDLLINNSRISRRNFEDNNDMPRALKIRTYTSTSLLFLLILAALLIKVL